MYPCVRLAEQNPPLRPDAPYPVSCCSRMTTSRSGSNSFANKAVHRPVNPAPTMQRSAPSSPMSAGCGSGSRGSESIHHVSGSASARCRNTKGSRESIMTALSPHPPSLLTCLPHYRVGTPQTKHAITRLTQVIACPHMVGLAGFEPTTS